MFKKIICATDLSPRSDEALHTAIHMATRFGAALMVLNVHEEFMDKDEMVMLRVSVEQMQERFREIAVNARKLMAEQVAAIGVDNLDVEYVLREGKGGEAIVHYAQEIAGSGDKSDTLIVMGTNGKHALLDRLLGSVAQHVVKESPYPVLVVPAMAG
jgi:nucleotide-binding universal stress UspA family protein